MYVREFIILHHTAAEEKDTAQIKRYHLGIGYRDIGYNYVIEKNGRIVTGRPLSIPGAHCIASGMNKKSIGIALIGNFENRRPHPVQIASLNCLLRQLHYKHNIKPANILLHKQVKGSSTKCPGRYFELPSLELGF